MDKEKFKERMPGGVIPVKWKTRSERRGAGRGGEREEKREIIRSPLCQL